MSIESFIKKVCKQTTVYWATPVKDGYGNYTYATPVEIKCRWEDKVSIINGENGQQETCSASVLVYQDLTMHGYLYLGTLASLSAAQKANPKLIDRSYEIAYFEKIPLIFSTTKFVRRALIK